MKDIFIDQDTSVVSEAWAVVYAPRKGRKRFSLNCVDIVESRQAAEQGADNEQKRFAAKVLGPSRSSEGLMLYYLVEWLD